MAAEVGGTLFELYFGSPERLPDGYSDGSGAREKQSRTRRRGVREGAGPDAAGGVSLVEAAVSDAVGVGEP